MQGANTCTGGQFVNLHRDANRLKQRRGPLRIIDVGTIEENWKCQPVVKSAELPSGQEC